MKAIFVSILLILSVITYGNTAEKKDGDVCAENSLCPDMVPGGGGSNSGRTDSLIGGGSGDEGNIGSGETGDFGEELRNIPGRICSRHVLIMKR